MSNGFIACTLKCVKFLYTILMTSTKEREENMTGFVHIDGTRVIFLVPNHS